MNRTLMHRFRYSLREQLSLRASSDLLCDVAPTRNVGCGGRTRTRTLDPLIKSQLLYQLSYAPEGRESCAIPELSSSPISDHDTQRRRSKNDEMQRTKQRTQRVFRLWNRL